ncbi:exodeoxyribonuclease VII large subunit [Mangrovibacterium marinum]|uniref:Exodeoxyribonuclease 7 large subunit n=2 Tax=Mangrovibacterium marinum TaxID=1639118 RepID=A0A2T5C1K2_9BACT|nr:exodeoxyribonuclease VII large subunit [Mangrovibacterium marinum]PTN08515.1 exodeoxyribonuclease VII large subunit [Mangrovibacterium marinum]
MRDTQLSLLELNQLVKNTLDDAFSNLVWVKAEISEMTVNRTGHCYLELVDVDPATKAVLARARATIWSYSFRMLRPYFETTTGQAFSQGIKVLVSVKVEYHPVYGFSLNIRDIDPSYTMGDMARKRREIIQQLQEDGVFDMNRELELPLVPQRIAVVSSPTAAGLQDFMDQLANNPQGIHFYTKLFPAVMQGSETADSIIHALEQVFQYEDFFDVVCIMRGGGAQLDLASFDHYELAYHVAQFPIPVITGIGHDKDETVIDLVAHTKMKTPTAVAEFLINGAERFEQLLQDLQVRFADLLAQRLAEEQEFLEEAVASLKQGVRQLVSEEEHRFEISRLHLQNRVPRFLKQKTDRFQKYSQRLSGAGQRLLKDEMYRLHRKAGELQYRSQRLLAARQTKLDECRHVLKIRMTDGFRLQTNKLEAFEVKKRLVDPVRVLQRGYSLAYKNGRIVKSVADLGEGDQLETRLADGKVISKIINK